MLIIKYLQYINTTLGNTSYLPYINIRQHLVWLFLRCIQISKHYMIRLNH